MSYHSTDPPPKKKEEKRKTCFTTLETIVCICPRCSVLFLKHFPSPSGAMYNVYVSVLVSPSSCWMQFMDRFDLMNRQRSCVWMFGERVRAGGQAGGLALWERSTRAPCESTWLSYMLPAWQTAQTPGSPVRERSVKASAALQGHALCRKLSLSLCPLLCGKNRSTDLSVQLFFMLLTFTWISPGAVAVGSCLAFLCLCVNVCVWVSTRTCLHTLLWASGEACVSQGYTVLSVCRCTQILIKGGY